MKFILFLLPIIAQGQQLTLSVTSAKVGQPITVSVSLVGSGNVAAAQWALNTPAVAGSFTSVAGKGLSCSTGGCVFSGGTGLTPPGVIASFTMPMPATVVSVTLTGISAADAAGGPVALSAGPSVNITPPNPCDLDGDGKATLADVQLVIDAIVEAMRGGGVSAPTGYDVNGDGFVNVLDAQRVIAAAVSGVCRTGG